MTLTTTNGTGRHPFELAPGTALHGEIITWNFRGLEIRHYELVEALEACGLDGSIVRDILPRNAFARACRKLTAERIIRQVAEDHASILFQFTAERRDGDGFLYERETLLTLRKSDGEIACEVPGIATLAREALDGAMGVRTTSDVSTIIMKLCNRESDIFPIKDGCGGAYFVPQSAVEFLEKVECLVKRLGGSIARFPIPRGTAQGDTSVRSSVAGGLDEMIAAHREAVGEFSVDTRASTFTRAAERIKATRHKILAYAEYLGAERERLEEAVAEAQRELLARVAEIEKEKATEAATA
jgi:hypothetical protein